MCAFEARRGGIFFVVAGALVVLAGASAWVVDLAAELLTRTHAQAAADAGAIAAADSLIPGAPDTAGAQSSAISYAQQNGYAIAPSAVTFWDYTPPNGLPAQKAATVAWNSPVNTSFARIFGITQNNVAVSSSATLGGLAQVPAGALPFGLPAYQDASGNWWALSNDTGTYSPLTANPAPTLMLKVGAHGSNSGNFLALALGGNGASVYRGNIENGAAGPLQYGQSVSTEPGNMVGPTSQGVSARLAKGADWANIYVPMIAKSEWDNLHGRSDVTIIGFVSAHLNPITSKGEVTATFQARIVPTQGHVGASQSPGAYAPVLILPSVH
jgi:Flp pilus assembly protein TadG